MTQVSPAGHFPERSKVRVVSERETSALGARAFLPGSQVELRPVHNLDGLKGTELEVRIINLNNKRGNIVVSRKQLLEEEQGEKRAKTLEQLSEGAILTGTVKNLTNYGAFVIRPNCSVFDQFRVANIRSGSHPVVSGRIVLGPRQD